MRSVKYALVGLVALGASAAGSASAMPMLPLVQPSSNIENVRWVCGPFRCFWQPNYYGYYSPGPRFYYGGGPRFYGGWRRGWRRW